MAKSPDFQRSAEQLKEVAIFLKQADKLVREGSFAAALDEIAKARARDPRNLYALAYEERVRSLMTAQKVENKAEHSPDHTAQQPQPMPSALEHISNLAIVEAQRSAAVAAKQEQEVEHRKKEEDDRRKNDELRRQAIESKISAFLQRAADYETKGDFNRALDEIARAYLLDPANERIHGLEDRVRRDQEDARAREETERIRRKEDEERKRHEALKAQVARLQQEKEEKRKKEEEARRYAQQQKIKQYLKQAQEMYTLGRMDEALSELAFVVVVDPLNEEVLELERKIREAQEREQQAQVDLYRKREDEQRKKREAIVTAIQKHIENADRLAAQQKFSEALRVVTRAYVLDPINESLQACEKRIVASQEENLRALEVKRAEEEEAVRKHQEKELRLMEQAERDRALLGENAETEAKRRTDKERIFQYLTKARAYLSENRYEDALGEVALAFVVNPFDEDVKHMEQDILALQEQKKAEEATAAEQTVRETPVNDTPQRIAEYLAEASRFAQEHEYGKALDEVTKAFILDPLDESIQNYELELQTEAHEHQSIVQKEQEEETRAAAIKSHAKRAKDFLQQGAFDEALAEVSEGFTYDPANEELRLLEEQIQSLFQQMQEKQTEEERDNQVHDLIENANSFLSRQEYDNALMEITKALVVDPTREELRTLEEKIETAQKESERKIQTEENEKIIKKHIFRAKEAVIHHGFAEAFNEIEKGLSIDPAHKDLLDLKEQMKQQEIDWNATKAQKEKDQSLREHIKQARQFFKEGNLAEALIEVTVGQSIDPRNEDLKNLEEAILATESNQDGERADEDSDEQAQAGGSDEQGKLVRIHLRAADELQKQNKFSDALDEVAKAYVIDPLNKEIKKIEIRIRQNEIRHAQQTGQTLKLIYPNDKAANGE
jgi:hypothetical protein